MTEPQPWQWLERTWRGHVARVRAGRSLHPASWPGGARVAVALSFDCDHETSFLRVGETGPGALAQGEYGSRVGARRVLRLLERFGVPASFFVPAVSALLHPEEVRDYVAAGHEIGMHGWIHESNTTLDPADERDLALRSADTLERLAGTRPVGHPHSGVGLLRPHPGHNARAGPALRLVPHGRRRAVRAAGRRRADRRRGDPGRVDQGRRALPAAGVRRHAAGVPAAAGRGRDLARRVRRRAGGGRALPAHHAPAGHRPPLPHDRAAGAHRRAAGRLVRHPRPDRRVRPGAALITPEAARVTFACATIRSIL
ncbi:polysaccharide deacetylase family protein [Actinomadura monticuli]|uniref:polysaccharide deacetylase family protein n=1 Tax=Actinomadura monticuli TaxID=3097367 RepID=UPI00356192AE